LLSLSTTHVKNPYLVKFNALLNYYLISVNIKSDKTKNLILSMIRIISFPFKLYKKTGKKIYEIISFCKKKNYSSLLIIYKANILFFKLIHFVICINLVFLSDIYYSAFFKGKNNLNNGFKDVLIFGNHSVPGSMLFGKTISICENKMSSLLLQIYNSFNFCFLRFFEIEFHENIKFYKKNNLKLELKYNDLCLIIKICKFWV